MPLSHHRLLLSTLSLLAIAPPGPVFAREGDAPPAEEVRAKVNEWVETRKTLSAERSEWASEKRTLKDLNGLRQREIEQLDEFIQTAGERVDEIAGKRKAHSEERSDLKSWRRNVRSAVAGFEKRLRPLLPRFPEPLRAEAEEAIARLENPTEDAPLQDRARDVLLVLQAYLKFQGTLTIDTDVREIEGSRREVEVLYLGMTQAWYVDSDGTHGGRGVPTAEGWKWTPDDSLAPRVRRAIEMKRRLAEPDFVNLPIQNRPIAGGGGNEE